MAQRRMFNIDITGSDDFMELSFAAQALYLHVCMAADDDGLVASARKITRSMGAAASDLNALLEAGFLLDLGDNIIAVKHWRMNNYLQRDRYKPSAYTEKLALLYLKPNKAYTLDPNKGEPLLDVIAGSDGAAAAGSFPQAVEKPEKPVNNNKLPVDNKNVIKTKENGAQQNAEAPENPQSLENTNASNLYTECIQDVHALSTQIRLDKIRLDKIRLDKANSLQQQKKPYGDAQNIMLTDEEAEQIFAKFKYPAALFKTVANYLQRAPDRPADRQNHFALCMKIGLEEGLALNPAAGGGST